MTKRRVWDLSCILQHCRVTELVDVSDFDSDAAKLGGSSPSSVAIMSHIPSYGGEDEEKAKFEIVRTSRHSSRQLLRLGVRLLRFYEFFVVSKNKLVFYTPLV